MIGVKSLTNRFLKALRKRSFEDAAIRCTTSLIKSFYGKSIDKRRTLLPALYAGITSKSVSMAVKRLKRKGYEVHSNKTVLEKLKDFKSENVKQLFEHARKVILKVAKKFSFHRRRMLLAIDFHDKPFYGDKTIAGIVGTKNRAGTYYAYRYATICIVEEGQRFNLACLPITQLDLRKDIVFRLLKAARLYTRIGIVLLDRGFDGTKIFDLMANTRTKCITPLTKNDKIKKLLEDKSNAGRLVMVEYIFYENRPEEYQTKVNLIISRENGDEHVFATNINGSKEQVIQAIVDVYRKRWGIETGYRTANEFYALTTSKNYSLRCFVALLSFLLQDLWILRNFVVQYKTAEQQPRSKLLTGHRKLTEFLLQASKELSFYWRPSIEIDLFKDEFIDDIIQKLCR